MASDSPKTGTRCFISGSTSWRENGQEYKLWRVVKLGLLRYMPQEHRQLTGLTEKMRAALVGLYGARRASYDLLEIKAGIFNPPLGVLQMYGAVGIANSLEAAVRNAELGYAAVHGAIANFEQSRLIPPTVQIGEWLRRAFAELPHVIVVIGHPEPRISQRGMGREGPGEYGHITDQQPLPPQQAEMLCRALSAVQEEFLMITMASRVAQHDLARMLAGAASEASVLASQVSGSEVVSTGIVLPMGLMDALSRMAGVGYGKSNGTSVSDSVADSEVKSHTVGHATTVGRAVTDGWAHTEGVAHTSGSSVTTSTVVTEGTAHTDGKAHTEGVAHTVGTASTSGSSNSTSVTHVPTVVTVATGTSWGVSDTVGTSHAAGVSGGMSTATTVGTAQSTIQSASDTTQASTTVSAAQTQSSSETTGSSFGGSVSQSWGGELSATPAGVGLGINGGTTVGLSGSVSQSTTHGTASTTSVGVTTGSSHTTGHAEGTTTSASTTVGTNAGWSISASSSAAHSVSSGGSQVASVTPAHTIVSTSSSSFSSTTTSESTTHSSADTVSTADTTSKSVSHGVSYGSFSSTTHSVADTVSHAETQSWARTTSVADGVATGTTRAHGTTRSSGTTVARALGVGQSTGLSIAAAPSFSLSRAYQWYNDAAAQLAQLLRAQEELLRQATLDGAFLTDVYILTRTERGAAVAETAVRQAFQGAGPLVVTPVQSRILRHPAEEAYIRAHAMAFTPPTRRERIAGALEMYLDSTLLLPVQLAAYVSPVLFEEGLSVTTQERIPAFAFVPDMPGDVILGHQYSTERGELTAAPLRMSQDRFFHTVFAADTGYGKTVAAERLVVETTGKWHFRTVVLDFGAGWRRLLNAPLPPGRVEVWQLFPGALVPFRWNPWQVGKRIQPERQYVATCEIFKNAGRMGPRQLGFMRRAARQLYLENGVLTSDREVWADPKWNQVRDEAEEEAINAARRERGLPERSCIGKHLADLEGFERQALAVHRSRRVDMSAWVERLASYKPELEKRRDQASLQSLEGVLLRLEPFTQGEMARMYGSGEDTLAVENLGLLGPPEDPWGISILEGGAELDEYAKAAILGLVAWHLYNDAVVRRRQNIGKSVPDPTLQIIFEEANKVLTGVETDASEKTGGATTVELFQAMWRDGRKYRIFLHPVVQTVSELPPGILSSCNNGFFSQTKNPKDRDLIMAHLAFSEKGFTDEDYKRFLSRMPAAMAIAKLGYSQDIIHTTPFLVRPLMVPAREPTDEEIYEAMHLMGRV